MPVLVGSSFQMYQEETGQWSHPWFIITTPQGPDGDALAVNATRHDPYGDKSCVLAPGDHPLIREESVIAYGLAKILPTAHLDGASPTLVRQEPPDQAVLERIQQGGLKTKHLTPKMRRLLERELGPPPDEGAGSA